MLTQTCLKQGPGIPLVFLHGFLGSPEDWLPVCSYLPPCHCIGIELPGHGKTPFTKNFFEAMPPIPHMHLIGYSMGGRLALQYAVKFPEKIASLTLLSAHCGLHSAKEKKERILIDTNWAKKMHFCFKTFLQEWYAQPIFYGFIPDLSVRLKHNPTELSRTLLHYSLGNQSRLSPQKAHIIVGMHDTKYRSFFPDATVIPKAGHMVHLENPKAVATNLSL